MTKYCESCHTANSDSARYCKGCKGKFSGVRRSAHLSAAADIDTPGPGTERQLVFARPAAAATAAPVV